MPGAPPAEGAEAVLKPSRPLLLLIRSYQQAISPLLPPACRYAPTCSQYALEAIEAHGALRGVWLALRRLSRCHPGRKGGYDPVPGRDGHPRTARTDLPRNAKAN